MAAYRPVKVTVAEVRATDYIVFDGREYELLGWSSLSEMKRDGIIGKPHLQATNFVAMRLQRILPDSERRLDHPISVLVGRADALDVLVRVDLGCTSDDPGNHQGDTCLIHEEV